MALARVSLMLVKAAVVASVQLRACLLFMGRVSIELSGSKIVAQLGIQRW